MKVRVEISRRPGIADPEGTTVARALPDLGFEDVGNVRFGRIIHITLEDQDPAAARDAVTAMCEKLLANPVMEDYRIEIQEPESAE